jgi:peptidoglycan/LPS O-acetylase OafA/YrhL
METAGVDLNQERRRLEDIEVLRAVAIMLTIAIHATYLFPHWGSAAIYRYLDFRVGVDLFFVISGFVIAQSALPRLTMEHGNSAGYWRNAIAFWLRRAWRIWPSAWLWLAVIVACTLFMNKSGVFGDSEALRGTFREVAASLLQVMNFSLMDTQILRPGSVITSTGATFPYWSLSLEEQFYLVLPLAIFATRKYLPLVLFIVAAAMFAVPKGLGSAWFFARYDPIILGVLIALWKQHPSYSLLEPRFLAGGSFRKIAFTSSLALLAAAAVGLGVVPFSYGVVSLLCGVLVFAASFGKDYLFPAGRARTLLLWIGSRSYAIYLCHAILFLVTRELWFRWAPPESRLADVNYTLYYVLTAMVLVGIASELNYRFVEQPFRAKGRRLAEAIEFSLTAPVAAASAASPPKDASPVRWANS